MIYIVRQCLRQGIGTSFLGCKTLEMSRFYSDNKSDKEPEFKTGTIIVENNLNVQELPVIIRKVKDLTFISGEKISSIRETSRKYNNNYNLIKAEFTQCPDLKDVFALLSKCIKITPEIALGAVERISELEKTSNFSDSLDTRIVHVNVAKDAILEKLLKIIIKSEDNKILLSVLNIVSSFLDPYVNKFSDELLVRLTENKLSIEELCMFIFCLAKNKMNPEYAHTIDKLWVGFLDRENAINEDNIVKVFQVLLYLKTSRRTLLSLLEKKLENLWYKLKAPTMLEIMNTVMQDIHLSECSLAIIGRWMNTNIHVLDEDSLLEFVTKITKLNYTDSQIQKALERYIKMRADKIQSQVLVVSILNHCMNFNVANKTILNGCSEYILINGRAISHTLLKSLIYPFGFLYFNPINSEQFWSKVEEIVLDKLPKMTKGDILSIVLASIYVGNYPFKLIDKIFGPQFMREIISPEERSKLLLIDTALSLECGAYTGPFLPKNEWPKSIQQDNRLKSMISSIKDTLELVAGGSGKILSPQLVPHIVADETYLIDVIIHSNDFKNGFSWKLKSDYNLDIAILIHLPEHYCYDTENLVGPQMMRRKHIKLLGFKVVSLKYSTINKLKRNRMEFQKYLEENLNKS